MLMVLPKMARNHNGSYKYKNKIGLRNRLRVNTTLLTISVNLVSFF